MTKNRQYSTLEKALETNLDSVRYGIFAVIGDEWKSMVRDCVAAAIVQRNLFGYSG